MEPPKIATRVLAAALISAVLSSFSIPAAAVVPFRRSSANSAKVTEARVFDVLVTNSLHGKKGNRIEWRTSFEVDNLGFNVYRETSAERVRVNSALIAGSALVVAQSAPLYAGKPYEWFDAFGSAASTYYLEAISIQGTKEVFGPFSVAAGTAVTKTETSPTLSSVSQSSGNTVQTEGAAVNFGRDPISPAAIEDQWQIAAQPAVKIGVKQDGWYRVTQPELVAAGFDVSSDARNLRLFVGGRETAFNVSRGSGALTSGDYIEFYGNAIETPATDTRVYYLLNGSQTGARISLSGEIHIDGNPSTAVVPAPAPVNNSTNDLPAPRYWFPGVSAGLDGRKSEKGETVELKIVEEGRSIIAPALQTTDAVADKVKTETAEKTSAAATEVVKTAAAELTVASTLKPAASATEKSPKQRRRQHRAHSGRRFISGSLQSKPKRKRNHLMLAAAANPAYLYTAQLKEKLIYFSALLNGEADNFFGQIIAGSPTTETLSLDSAQTESGATVRFETALQGVSSQPHSVAVLLNDVTVGTLNFGSLDHKQQSFDLAPSLLREGANTVKFVPANSGDVSLIDFVRVSYPRAFQAVADSLSFSARSSQSITAGGFTTPDIKVLDLTNPLAVQEIHPVVQGSAGAFTITVPALDSHAKASRNLVAFRANSFLHPAFVTANQPSTLNNAGNAADFLIISHRDFIASLAPLVAQRQAQGFTVRAIDVEDVYDEFSFGQHSSQALTDFLARARAQWSLAPRYLLLVGDGSYDPQNHLGFGNFDFVPTKLVDTVFMETASDDALADFDGDGIPELSVGRLAVRTAAEADREVAKIVNFSPANVPQTALMVADAQGTYFFDFEGANDSAATQLPAGMTVQKVYRRLEPSDAVARTDIINKINQGVALVNYSGHGTIDVWTSAPIFSQTDALGLSNGNRLPLVVVMDCLNGYFVAPNVDCVGEAFLKAANGGAVASFASSGLTIPTGQHQMSQKLYQLIYGAQSIPLGDATRQAKAATTDLDVRRSWILFGDPSLKIR
jgi:hypothetical protein